MDKVDDNDDNSEDSEDSYGEGLYGTSGAGYATKNLKSFRHYTREALPRADHYRNVESVHGFMARPTLDELHGTQATVSFDSNTVSENYYQLSIFNSIYHKNVNVNVKVHWQISSKL